MCAIVNDGVVPTNNRSHLHSLRKALQVHRPAPAQFIHTCRCVNKLPFLLLLQICSRTRDSYACHSHMLTQSGEFIYCCLFKMPVLHLSLLCCFRLTALLLFLCGRDMDTLSLMVTQLRTQICGGRSRIGWSSAQTL